MKQRRPGRARRAKAPSLAVPTPTATVLPPHLAQLSAADQVFVLEYFACHNATDAYLKAHPGAARTTAATEGSRRLREPAISEAIRLERSARFRQLEIDDKEILGRLVAIATADIREIYDDDGELLPPAQWPDRIAVCVESYEQKDGTAKVKLAAKFPALVKLAEKAGLFEKDGATNDLGKIIEAMVARRRPEEAS